MRGSGRKVAACSLVLRRIGCTTIVTATAGLGNDTERFVFYAFNEPLLCGGFLSPCKRRKYFKTEDDTLQLPRIRKAFLSFEEQ